MGAGERYVELAQVFPQPFAVGVFKKGVVSVQAQLQLALVIVPAQRQVVLFDRAMVGDKGQKYQRVL